MAAARSISEEFDLSKCMARRLRSSMTATLLLADTPNENAQGSLAMEAIEAYLPEYLKKELAASVHKKLFDNVSIFKNTTPAFLEALARRLRPQVCLAGDCLIREGDIDKEMYFVRSGELQVIAWNSEKDQEIVLHTLRILHPTLISECLTGPGSFCGELALVADVKRTATVRATVLSWLLMLTEEDMRLAHERFPDDFLIVQDVARLRLQEHRRKTGYSEKLKAAKQKLRLISAGRVLAHNAATRRFLGFSSESSSVPESPATPLTPTVTRSRPERETPEGHISSPDSSITQLTQVTRRSYTDIEDLILDPLVIVNHLTTTDLMRYMAGFICSYACQHGKIKWLT
ncbi:cyclic nucleotide gated channel alpha [Perkinsus chesapeaki]|uniref:Cyclic nucleotide gated channel alpha n=1 Tax=Perkinsus chesapeaki TaxID=330153 RepID=A0A7J6MB26_PERCH|nr:cyclic nucleotide gated channel alpha [Perkinsus chesapeaki]